MRAERRYRLLVFDWDGTIVDTAALIVDCIQAAARDLGVAAPKRERASHVIGLGLRDALRAALPDLPESRHAEFATRYRAHFLAREHEMRPFPGVPALLEALALRGHRLAVATGKSRAGLERALAQTGLRALFAATRCADECRPKPHPAMLEALLRQFDCAPQAALMIGDTSHDVAMAHAAEVDALGVLWGAHPELELRAAAPRACVATVEELSAWLARHG